MEPGCRSDPDKSYDDVKMYCTHATQYINDMNKFLKNTVCPLIEKSKERKLFLHFVLPL